jgi:hypothetical protein
LEANHEFGQLWLINLRLLNKKVVIISFKNFKALQDSCFII